MVGSNRLAALTSPNEATCRRSSSGMPFDRYLAAIARATERFSSTTSSRSSAPSSSLADLVQQVEGLSLGQLVVHHQDPHRDADLPVGVEGTLEVVHVRLATGDSL